MSNDCIFCKIVAGEIPANKVFEDDKVLAFLDIKPVNPGHVLVIPKTHAEFLTDVDDNDLCQMIKITKKIDKSLRGGLDAQGVNLFYADGAVAGQEISHAHIHIIPRYKGDGFGLKFPEHYGREYAPSEAKEIAAKLKIDL